MNLRKRFAISLSLFALAGLAATAANAQTVLRGDFTLPEQAYWCNTLLPAGGYTLSLVRQPSGINMVFVKGEGLEATFMAPSNAEEISERSVLKVDEINGTRVIRELDAGFLGKSYRFAVSKAVREMTLSGSIAKPLTVALESKGE